jgi:heavy metal response regulator
MKILLVEDDRDIARFVTKGLQENGFSVEAAHQGDEGCRLAVERDHDLIILDIMLPGMDGWQILNRLRTVKPRIPVIFLTARDSETEIIQGLNSGADDYLTKPFSFNELLARIRALLRRDARIHPLARLEVADLVLHVEGHRVFRGTAKIDLTPTEYALLEYFMRHVGQVVTRTMLAETIWDVHFDTSTNVIDVHVSHLRNKIDRGGSPRLLHTIKGVGYVLEKRG